MLCLKISFMVLFIDLICQNIKRFAMAMAPLLDYRSCSIS